MALTEAAHSSTVYYIAKLTSVVGVDGEGLAQPGPVRKNSAREASWRNYVPMPRRGGSEELSQRPQIPVGG